MIYLSSTEKQTFTFAKKYAKTLKGGEVIGLIGNLGAGKTAFTKGLASGLGIKKTITSPTFVLMKAYRSEVSSRKSKITILVHIDAYRLKTADDLEAIGATECFIHPDTITVIEWADRIKKILPKGSKMIRFKILKTGREIKY